MKKIKILLLTALAVVSLNSAFAQAQVGIGLKGGLNFANVNTKASSLGEAYNSRTGYHAGAFVLFKFTKIGVQPEFIFSQQGTNIKVNTTNIDANYSYFNIPVILKLYLAGGFNLQAGPQFGFLTAAEAVSTTGSVKTTTDIKDNVNSSDLSIGVGAGWDLPMGLNLDARYNIGVSDNNSGKSGSTEAVKNQVFQLSVGYKLFKLGN